MQKISVHETAQTPATTPVADINNIQASRDASNATIFTTDRIHLDIRRVNSGAAPPAVSTTATMAARDMRGVPDLPPLELLHQAIAAVHLAAVPHANVEHRLVDRVRRQCAYGSPALTPFHSVTLPELSLTQYALTVAEHTAYDAEGLAAGLALFARYAVASGRGVTPLTMHRLLGTCIQAGMKASSDRFLKNVYAAPAAGMTLPELNELEFALADALGFRLIPTATELCELPRRLAELHPAPTLGRVHEIFLACCHPEISPGAGFVPPHAPSTPAAQSMLTSSE